MALPHYKPQTQNQAQIVMAETFPVVLVPNDAPPKIARVLNLLQSGKFLTTLLLITGISGAALLWMMLEPVNQTNLKGLKLSPVIMLAAIFSLSLIALTVIAFLKKSTEAKSISSLITSPEIFLVPKSATPAPAPSTATNFSRTKPNLVLSKPRNLSEEINMATPPNAIIEWSCEEWSSAPFVEILEDIYIADVFPDEMVAPDHMIFCFEHREIEALKTAA